MRLRHAIKKLGIAIVTAFTAGALSGCARKTGIEDNVHESKYSVPFPLQQGGEQLDFLVRIKDMDRAYQFNLVLVEPTDWHEDRKDRLRLIYDGFRFGDDETMEYPIKLRIRIDSVGEGQNSPIHLDHEMTERSPLYGQKMGNTIWRVLSVYASRFQPGIYRVRVDNLAPAPQLDFETRFLFERDNRKY